MDLGAFELQIFVSLIVVLGAAFVALVCDYLKGSNEQLREHNIELRVRKDEHERRGILSPPRWLEQLVNTIQHKTQPAADTGPRPRTMPVESEEIMLSWASKQDLERTAQRGAAMTSRRWRDRNVAAETVGEHRSPLENWVNPETLARVAAKANIGSGERPDHAGANAAVAESKADIRDEIQRLVGGAPRPRRGKPEPVGGVALSADRIAASDPVIVESNPIHFEPVTAVAVGEPNALLTSEGFDPSHSVAAKLEPVVETHGVAQKWPAISDQDLSPSLGFGNDLERIEQSQQRFSGFSHPTGLQGVTQFPMVQVAPLKLEEELHRVSEISAVASKTSSLHAVSALLDEVIAASSHHSRREPDPELKQEPVEPVVISTSRSLLERQVAEAQDQRIGSDAADELAAVDTVEVVVPVQSLAEPEPLLEVDEPIAWDSYSQAFDEPAPTSLPLTPEPMSSEPEEIEEPEPMLPVLEIAPVMDVAEVQPAIEIAAGGQPEIELPTPTETAFSWPPPRPFHQPRIQVEPVEVALFPDFGIPQTSSIEEPRNLTCFEDQSPGETPQIPEPAVFQAMIESISLMPVTEQMADPDFDHIAGPTQAAPAQESKVEPKSNIEDSNDPLPDATPNEHPALLLPAGIQDRLTFSRLLEAPGVLSGVVVSISLNDYKRVQDALTHQAFEDLIGSIGKLMNGMIREQDFGVRLGEGDWVFVYRNELGAVAQKRILQISEKLWDFQLRSMGSVSILFGWGAVEVENERLSEAYNASIERMEQSRRGRKTVALDSRDNRRVANG